MRRAERWALAVWLVCLGVSIAGAAVGDGWLRWFELGTAVWSAAWVGFLVGLWLGRLEATP